MRERLQLRIWGKRVQDILQGVWLIDASREQGAAVT